MSNNYLQCYISPGAEIYYKEIQIVFTDFYIFGMLLKDIDCLGHHFIYTHYISFIRNYVEVSHLQNLDTCAATARSQSFLYKQ